MKLIFVLSKENLKLASLEVLSLTKFKDHILDDNVLILNSGFKDYFRLAFTRKVLRFLFSCNIDELEENLKKQDWQKYYSESFSLRAPGFNEKKLAEHVWYNVKNPKVNLENPQMQVEIIKTNNKVYCGILLHHNKEKFSKRKPHSRPCFHPSTIEPKLARCLVNLSGLPLNSTIYDPFCGTGGILIEAGLMGFDIVGSDLDKKMVERCITNLKHSGIKKYKVFHKNALKIDTIYDSIITDPPYGKASTTFSIKINDLYSQFFKNLEKISKKGQKIIFVTPSYAKFSTNFKIIDTIDFYVHHALTRKIHIFEKN